ncbi:Holliday junction resolvase RuvX [Rhodohalobacter mucosus]|uniref:Putative pre-16S rRNA nuclease n=1 Tax=Rhodohalobacter mucosus TaxID=2079485 RepID=A0A316TPT6_9BACT|nr:Holliday junction resolvase RuvX [Rhodohalobacter mucosus]PWN05681.1 Holliday junction resolvase RuvX [Rhodohalobacter mucosus]
MAKYGRILGVDVGSKRVGIARTDLLRTTANPVGTFSPEDSFKEIERQINREGPVIGIVVGWPLTPQGEYTNATEMAYDYIRHLEKTYTSIPVFKMDERFSSKQAMELMRDAGVPKSKRHKKGRLDQAAAALILQQFLESHPEM